MKRILHFGGVLLALGMLLASCNIGVGDGQVAGDSVRNTSNVEGITIGINNIDNTGRTILPADWNDGTAQKLTYVLLGKKSDGPGGYATKKTFSYSQLKSGTAVVNLDLVEWDLKLIGYITDEAYTTHPCLEKEILRENFSSGKKAVVFDLKPVDPTTTSATGNVDVTIAWLTDQPKRLEFGIYDIGKSTEQIVTNKGRGDAKYKATYTDGDFADEDTAYEMSWHQDDVEAGMYNFAAVFYDAEEDGNVIGYYIDILYVDGGNDSIATVNYGNKFNTQPENPTWLAVETAYVPQKLKTGYSDTDVYKWYYAKFHWNDVSTNETGFELVITEEDDEENAYIVNPTELAKTDHAWKADKWYDGTDEVPFPTTNPNRIDAGSTWVVVKLETEKRYTAKIRAINNYTPAYDPEAETPNPDVKFCKNLNQNGDGKGRIYAPIVPEGTGDNAVPYFGMFYVNYALSDGNVIEKKGAEATDASIKNYVVGFNYNTEQQYLMTDNILSYPHVSKPGSNFDHWDNDNPPPTAESARLDVISAKNKDNLKLTAVWAGNDVSVHVTFPSYGKVENVKIVKDKDPNNTFTFTYNNDDEDEREDKNTITIEAGENLVGPFTFELSEMGNNGKAVPAGTNLVYGTITPADKVWTWEPTERTPAGFYCLQITGYYEDTVTGRKLKLCGNIYIQVLN